jgi:hypothetical protein
MESQTEWDPGKPVSSVFLKDQEEHSTQSVAKISQHTKTKESTQ